MVDYRIDSHKLLYHPTRVADWLQGQNIFPIYVEMTPTGNCNHRCIFCALDYMGYKPNLLDKDIFLKNLPLMVKGGVKSMMFAGEGEPLMNSNTAEFVLKAKEAGLDVAMTTNGVLFTPEIAQACFGAFSWVRFSLNAGQSVTYDAVHRGRPGDFERVLANLRYLVEYKQKNKLATTIGVQMLLIPENQAEVLTLAEQVAAIGIDYFSVKPFSQHPLSICQGDPTFGYDGLEELAKELQSRYSGRMHIAFRTRAMEKLKWDKQYSLCHGLPFWAYVDAKARVWACSAHLGKEEFCYGDLHEADFPEVWEGERRAAIMNYVATKMDVKHCREICRLDEINIYLNELKNPGPHVNFI